MGPLAAALPHPHPGVAIPDADRHVALVTLRERLAGSLIRLAHRINQPTVTDMTSEFGELLLLWSSRGRPAGGVQD